MKNKDLYKRAKKLLDDKRVIVKHLKTGKPLNELEAKGYKFAQPL